MNSFQKFKKFLRTFPKKHHIEYITAFLSIPVLLSVIALNILNLQNNNKKDQAPTPTPTSKEQPVIIQVSPEANTNSPTTESSSLCKKGLGTTEISYPKEGQTVSDNPLCINIKYDSDTYCSAVWSYRINDGTWSNYNSNSPCLYNVPAGKVKFELRVQSTVSESTDALERNFIYQPPLSSPSASPSPNQ